MGPARPGVASRGHGGEHRLSLDGPPITVGGRRYIDGALRAGANADLAASARVLIVAEPAAHIFGPSPAPAGTVVRLAPDAAAIKAFGPDITAYDVWEPAYRAGLRQAADAAGAIRAVG